MLIILEGCDATGKTTLANMLSKVLDANIIHCTAETPNTYDFFRELAWVSEEKNIIADRFCYGQFVYQAEKDRPIIKSTSQQLHFDNSYEALYKLEMYMLRYKPTLIYTYSDVNTIANRMIGRGENPKDVDNILKGYNELWKKTSIKPIYFKT